MNIRLPAFALATCMLIGCGSSRVTDTPRTATEQLLVSAAVDQAVSQLDFSLLEERKTYLDDSLVDRVDKSFIIASVRAQARRDGVILLDKPDDASYILELRAGAVGVDRDDYVLGIPASSLPIGSTPIVTPEIAAYKSINQTGACRISFTVYRRDDNRFFYASGPAYGFSDHKARWIMGAGPGVKENIQPARQPNNTASIVAGPSSPDQSARAPE